MKSDGFDGASVHDELYLAVVVGPHGKPLSRHLEAPRAHLLLDEVGERFLRSASRNGASVARTRGTDSHFFRELPGQADHRGRVDGVEEFLLVGRDLRGRAPCRQKGERPATIVFAWHGP